MKFLPVVIGAVVGLVLSPPAWAQTAAPVTQPNVYRTVISAIPDTGDPATVPAVAFHELAMTAAMPECNKDPVPTATSPLVNPLHVRMDDPYHPNKDCEFPLPPNIPPGMNYRVVSRFYESTCNPTGDAEQKDCMSPRSAVAMPPFSIGAVPVKVIVPLPTAPTNLRLIP